MPTRSYYKKQAELLRAIAAATPDPGQRQQQLRRANEYMDLALSLPDDGDAPPVAVSRQSIGPQQQQIQSDKGEPENEG